MINTSGFYQLIWTIGFLYLNNERWPIMVSYRTWKL